MRKTLPLILILVVTAILITSCNYPLAAGNTTGNPTPDLTLTALFAPTQAPLINVNPTVGPTSASPTNSPAPTSTATTQWFPPTTLPPTPTKTLVPPTAAVIPVRQGPTVNAYYLSTKPVLDGNWGDWKDKAKEYGVDYVVYGKSNWTGKDDLEASYIVGWDGSFLYVAFKVRDDVYAQNATGADIYKGDSVELLIDTDLYGDFYTTSLNTDDYQLGISPGKGDISAPTETYLWYPKNIAGARPQVTAVSMGEAGLYRIEARIPWTMLNVSPYAGMHLGFVASVNDNDNTTENIEQTMMSGDSLRTTFLNPTLWGEVILK
jgi:hypothetical protein